MAGLTKQANSKLYGVVFEISSENWPIIQHKEGAVTGMCVERAVRLRAGGREVQGIAFVTSPSRVAMDGPVSPRFVEALVRGARSAGLPPDYVQRLEANTPK